MTDAIDELRTTIIARQERRIRRMELLVYIVVGIALILAIWGMR